MTKTKIRTNTIRAALSAAITASTFAMTSAAYAAGVITAVDLDANSLGGFVGIISVDNEANVIDLDKVFTSIAPITLRFTVGHDQGASGSYDVTEFITNGTGVNWTDYHLAIGEPVNGNGISFGSFQSATLNGFDLDGPPGSGPGALNFSGALTTGNTTRASFEIHLFDPGANNTYTFDLVQTPTVAGNPVPIPMAGWLFVSGLLVVGRFAKRGDNAVVRV